MSQQEQGIYEFHNFQLDIGKGILLREGQPVSMQWKTFETLCILVKSNGNLITTNELMDRLWIDTFVEENNLRQHISALRKALGENGNGCKFIETIPRRGYKFLPEVRVVDYAKQPLVSATPNNLSAPQMALIGREKEIAEIKNLLRREDVRLLTLTGVGGTGKTTLAQAVAREFLTDFEDGVFFVELAAVTNPEFVASTIAQTLAVKETGGKPIIEILKDYLRERHLLLVIDNFEQVLSAAPLLSELLKNSSDLKILVTSRARLNLSKDCEFDVPPLAVPESSAQMSLAELSKNESVRLFVERARAARPNFSLSEENARSVAEICSRLDGLPLAIELAAARTRIILPQSILERLENRLKLLTGGAKDLPTRQQTVRGTVEWSYELLDENEKTLFRRLAVFAGGFTFEAAEKVCGNIQSQTAKCALSSSEKEHSRARAANIDVLDGITSLLNNSLLVQKEQADGESRFRMLEVVREYALESLEASDEEDALRCHYAAYFLKLGKKAEPHLITIQAKEWLDRLEREHDNFRAALRWSLKNNAEIATQIATVITKLWVYHSHLSEGREWLKVILQQCNDAPSSVRLKLHNRLCELAWFQGDYETTQKIQEENLAEAKVADDKEQIALSSKYLGLVALQRGDFTGARNLMEESLAINRKINNKFRIASTLLSLGDLARVEGDNSASSAFYEEALVISRQLGFQQGVCSSLFCLGLIAYDESAYKTAHLYFVEGLDTAQKLGNKTVISYSLHGFAALATEREELERAAQLAGAAEHLRETVGYELEPVERHFHKHYLAKLRAIQGESAFLDGYEQGRKMKLDDAIKLALDIA